VVVLPLIIPLTTNSVPIVTGLQPEILETHNSFMQVAEVFPVKVPPPVEPDEVVVEKISNNFL